MKNDEEFESAELTLEELELVVGGQTPEAAKVPKCGWPRPRQAGLTSCLRGSR